MIKQRAENPKALSTEQRRREARPAPWVMWCDNERPVRAKDLERPIHQTNRRLLPLHLLYHTPQRAQLCSKRAGIRDENNVK